MATGLHWGARQVDWLQLQQLQVATAESVQRDRLGGRWLHSTQPEVGLRFRLHCCRFGLHANAGARPMGIGNKFAHVRGHNQCRVDTSKPENQTPQLCCGILLCKHAQFLLWLREVSLLAALGRAPWCVACHLRVTRRTAAASFNLPWITRRRLQVRQCRDDRGGATPRRRHRSLRRLSKLWRRRRSRRRKAQPSRQKKGQLQRSSG